MIEHVSLLQGDSVIGLASEIVYLQKSYWCSCSMQSLKLSIMGPRAHYDYDPAVAPRPCIIFFCGGGFQKQDRNVWIPELSYFAKHGYIVATVDYSTFAYTEFPEQLIEAKNAIRFLRAHAAEFHIDPSRIAAMGESAGGQIASWVAATAGYSEYEAGTDLEQSSAVQCCVAWYPVTNVNAFPKPDNLRVRMDNFPDTCTLINDKTPPFFLLHGTADSQVPYSQSIEMYDRLVECGVDSSLILLDGANHSDPRFTYPEIQKRILNFLDQHLI